MKREDSPRTPPPSRQSNLSFLSAMLRMIVAEIVFGVDLKNESFRSSLLFFLKRSVVFHRPSKRLENMCEVDFFAANDKGQFHDLVAASCHARSTSHISCPMTE